VCIASLAYDAAKLIGDISSLFSHPHLKGTANPRPRVVGSPDFGVPDPGLNRSILGALGLPDSSCEFGVCISNFTEGRRDPQPLISFSMGIDVIKGTALGLTRLLFTGHFDPQTPAAVCVKEATEFAEKYDAASRKVIYGKASDAVDILRAKDFTELTGAFYKAYAGDKALSDAAYDAALRKCMNEGR
jgi:hypothetical protein